MGGEDWRRWMEMLLKKSCSPKRAHARLSYIGPNHLAIYRDGTIGRRKKLERAANRAQCGTREKTCGHAWVS